MIGADYVLSPSLQLRDGALAHNEQSFSHAVVYRKQLTSIAGHTNLRFLSLALPCSCIYTLLIKYLSARKIKDTIGT